MPMRPQIAKTVPINTPQAMTFIELEIEERGMAAFHLLRLICRRAPFVIDRLSSALEN